MPEVNKPLVGEELKDFAIAAAGASKDKDGKVKFDGAMVNEAGGVANKPKEEVEKVEEIEEVEEKEEVEKVEKTEEKEEKEEVEEVEGKKEEKEEKTEESEESPEDIEKRSLNDDDSKDDKAKEAEVKEQTEKTVNEEVSHRTEGKYHSLKDLQDAHDALLEQADSAPKFATPLLAKLNELAASGINVDLDFIRGQMIDFDNYSLDNNEHALQLVQMKLRAEDPDITPRLMEIELRKYNALFAAEDEEGVTKQHRDDAEAYLLGDARKALKAMKKQQGEYQLPTGVKTLEELTAQRTKNDDAAKALTSNIVKEISEYSSETFKVGEEEITFNLDASHKAKIQKTILNADSFFKDRYIGENGIDLKTMKADMLKLDFFDEIVNTLVGQASSEGGKKVAAELKNQKTIKKDVKTDAKPKTMESQIANHFLSKGNK